MPKQRRSLRRWIVPIGLLVLIVFPFGAVRYIEKESDQAWGEFVEKWEAKGEQFELVHHLPPRIPDAENLARHPLLVSAVEAGSSGSSLLDKLEPTSLPGWSQDAYSRYLSDFEEPLSTSILRTFGLPAGTSPTELRAHLGDSYRRWSANLDLLAQAVRERAHLWFEMDWAKVFLEEDGMPDFEPYHQLGKALLTRAAIRRGLQDAPGTLEDLVATLRIAQAYSDIPLLLTLVYQTSLHASFLDELRATLRDRLFDRAQLAELSTTMGEAPSSTGCFLRALRMERAMFLSFLDTVEESDDPELLSNLAGTERTTGIRRSLTKSWMSASRLTLCQDLQELFLGNGGNYDDLAPWEDAMIRRLDDKGDRFIAPLGHFTLTMVRMGGGLGGTTMITEADLNRARIAVALEGAHLETGSYPSDLKQLVPTFLPALPTPTDRALPVDYARLPDGSWRLRLLIPDSPHPEYDWTSK
ncbi:MAG: hypothetical protein VCA35_12635 [Roseibacillus sp.]